MATIGLTNGVFFKKSSYPRISPCHFFVVANALLNLFTKAASGNKLCLAQWSATRQNTEHEKEILFPNS